LHQKLLDFFLSVFVEIMPRGPKKHLKRLNAPHHWMLDKMGGVYAPRPTTGPHKMRECLPLIVLLRNRLKYALTKREVTYILMQRLVQVDGRVRTDSNFPAGFMDVITIQKTNENFRLLFDPKGRFFIHRISPEEAKFKLCRVKKVLLGAKGIPYIVTHDGRTIRYPDPVIKKFDTVKVNLATGKIEEIIKFDVGNLCMVTGGNNKGRVGVIEHRERHDGDYDVIHVKDALNHTFITRDINIFAVGHHTDSLVSLPPKKGVRTSIIEDQQHFTKNLLKGGKH